MIRIAHLSDIHFGALDAPVAAALVPYLRALAADVLVMSGDFTMRATSAQYRAATAWLGSFDIPRLVVPGNHDVPLHAIFERAVLPFRRYRKYVSHELSPTYENDELILFGVNTARAFVLLWDGFWKDGSISARDIAHLKAFAASSKRKILVTHHPFVQPPGHRAHGVILGGTGLLPMLASWGVDILLAGHLHASYYQLLHGNVLSIQASTATSLRRRHSPAGAEYANGFNVLSVDGNALVLDVHEHLHGEWRLTRTARFAHESTGWRILP